MHFLLQFSNNDLNSVPLLICDLRKTLRFNDSKTNRTENDQIQRAVFDRIFTALIQSKKLFDIWLKTIQNATESDREPSFDFLVLLVMQSVNDEKRNAIENIVSMIVMINKNKSEMCLLIFLVYLDSQANQIATVYDRTSSSHYKQLFNRVARILQNVVGNVEQFLQGERTDCFAIFPFGIQVVVVNITFIVN